MKDYKRLAIFGFKDKGGLGLSTAMIAIITVLRAIGEGEAAFEVCAIDADGFNGSLTQRLAERDPQGKVLAEQNPVVGVAKADLFMRDGAGPIFEAVESAARVVVVDTPAGGLTQIDKMSESLSARDLVQHCLDNDRKPVVLVPFGPGIATIRGVGSAIDRFGPDAQIVAARTTFGVMDHDYRLWSTEPLIDRYGRTVGGQVRRKFENAGGRLIDMPTCPAGPNALAEALSLSYRDAVTYKGAGWRQFHGLNIRNWLNLWAKQLGTNADVLGMQDVDWNVLWEAR